MMNTLVSTQSTQAVAPINSAITSKSHIDEAQDIDAKLALPTWSRVFPALILFANWGLLLWLGTFLESMVAQLILLPLSMLGVALAWGWHRD